MQNLLYLLGRAALVTQDNQPASEALRRAVVQGFAPGFGYLAEALQRLDRPDEALKSALQRLKIRASDTADACRRPESLCRVRHAPVRCAGGARLMPRG
jgi:uncharacterized protein HemY